MEQRLEMICGDVRQELPKLESDSADCVIAAPPYWATGPVGYEGDLGNEGSIADYVSDLVSIFDLLPLKPAGDLWVVCSDLTDNGYLQPVPWELVLAMRREGWHFVDDVVWTASFETHEFLLRFSRVPARKSRRSVWGPPTREEGLAHERYLESVDSHDWVSLPWWLAARMILASTAADDVVLNPFAGFGTVGIECQRLGRGYVGIELREDYVEQAEARLRESPAFVD